MKLYGIVESYVYYKGGDATNWGVYKSLEDAKKALLEIIEDKFGYIKDMFDEDGEDVEEEWNKWVNHRFVNTDGSLVMWEDEDDDAVTKFYIDELEIDV